MTNKNKSKPQYLLLQSSIIQILGNYIKNKFQELGSYLFVIHQTRHSLLIFIHKVKIFSMCL